MVPKRLSSLDQSEAAISLRLPAQIRTRFKNKQMTKLGSKTKQKTDILQVVVVVDVVVISPLPRFFRVVRYNSVVFFMADL